MFNFVERLCTADARIEEKTFEMRMLCCVTIPPALIQRVRQLSSCVGKAWSFEYATLVNWKGARVLKHTREPWIFSFGS